MQIGILREPGHEKRVCMTPDTVRQILSSQENLKFAVEKDAGASAFISDQSYQDVGAEIVDRAKVLSGSDLILNIQSLTEQEIRGLRKEQVIIGQFSPMSDREIVRLFQETGLVTFSMDIVPRTTRAQSMDVLSSMSTVAGYKAVLVATDHFQKFFPMLMTAAGSIAPAKVLILGAGVAGLMAIATARRLGAVVEASDVRLAAREEVLSLGAKFVDVEGATEDKSAGGYAVEQSEEFKKRQAEVVQERASKSDIIICTAQIPGRKAPLLISAETVAKMKPGSVIVDMAASTGGNCALTEDGKTVLKHGVTIIGDSNIATQMAADSSKMYGKNLHNFLKLIVKEGEIALDFEDDIVAGTCLTKEGEVVSDWVKKFMND